MKRLVAAITAIVLATGNTFAFTGSQYLPQAKLTPKRARQLAEKAWPGEVLSEELEEEAGGSGLRYSFIIQQGNTKHEVGIDAKTGKLLENSITSGEFGESY
jgi:uncharacterized membrane protein YkoI